MCFSYLYAGLYVHGPFTTVTRICAQVASALQYVSLINFVVVPVVFAIMSLLSGFSFPPQVYLDQNDCLQPPLTMRSYRPIRFLCRTPSHKVLMCIVTMLGKKDNVTVFAGSCILINDKIYRFVYFESSVELDQFSIKHIS